MLKQKKSHFTQKALAQNFDPKISARRLTFSFAISFFTLSLFSILWNSLVLAKTVNDFSDQEQIPQWSHSAISSLLEKKIINGNEDGTFAPFDPINRAEFAKILILATQTEIPADLKSNFSDVPETAWFFDFVETARKKGWIEGYPDGLFRPAEPINHAEVSKILVKAFDLEAPEAAVGEAWFRPFLLTLEGKDLLPHDITLENINPSAQPTRTEIVEQIYRILSYLVNQKQALADLEAKAKKEASEIPETYNPSDENGLHSTISDTAGDLYIEKVPHLNQRVFVYHRQQNVEALRLKFTAQKDPVKVSELQFRRIGSGKFSDFSTATVAVDGKTISAKVLVQDDLIRVRLLQGFLIPQSKSREVTLNLTLSDQGEKGTSSRFVLYLPQWISADSEKRIGFFPFGGIDLEIKN